MDYVSGASLLIGASLLERLGYFDDALEDAGLTWRDIEAVVVGKAPDMFEGIMMPELWLADALGAVGKPLMRVHTAGSVGGSTALVADHLVQSGVHERVLTVAFEKQSESEATWAITPNIPFQMPLVAGAGGYFAPLIRAYIHRSKAPDHIGIKQALVYAKAIAGLLAIQENTSKEIESASKEIEGLRREDADTGSPR